MLILLVSCKPPLIDADYLTIVGMTPSLGATDISTEATIEVIFSESLVDNEAALTLTTHEGDAISGISTLVADDGIATFVPDAPLAWGLRYAIGIDGNFEGVSTGPLPKDVSVTFTTAIPGPGGDNQPPVADAGPDLSGNVRDLMVLDGSASMDPEGQVLDYFWRAVSRPVGSSAFIEVPNARSTAIRPDVAGTYVVGLTVNDGYNDSDEDQVTITVAP